jgi:hypothetical protein
MSLNQLIIDQYGMGQKQTLVDFQRSKYKLSSAKNRCIFLTKCLHHNIVPRFLRNKCPIRSKQATKITLRYRKEILKEAHYQACFSHHTLAHKVKKLQQQLEGKVTKEHHDLIMKIVTTSYEKKYRKIKAKLKNFLTNSWQKKTHQLWPTACHQYKNRLPTAKRRAPSRGCRCPVPGP